MNCWFRFAIGLPVSSGKTYSQFRGSASISLTTSALSGLTDLPLFVSFSVAIWRGKSNSDHRRFLTSPLRQPVIANVKNTFANIGFETPSIAFCSWEYSISDKRLVLRTSFGFTIPLQGLSERNF